MKLLYATTIVYPSNLANRIQILNNSYEFEKILKDNFILGAHKADIQDSFPNKNIVNFEGSRFSPIIGARYTYYIWKNKITHVYNREEMLLLNIYLMSFILLWRRPKFIYEAHWMFEHKNTLINYLFKCIRKKLELVVSITSYLSKELVKSGVPVEKIIICPDGVKLEDYITPIDTNKFKQNLNIPIEKKIFGYVGTYKTLNTKKGTDEILYAFSEILKTNKDVFLLFVGSGADGKKELTEDLLTLNVAKENFLIIERVAHKEVANYLRICDILLMTFPWTEHYAYIMSPMKLFEYIASQKPIITTDLPSVRDILNESSCTFCIPGDKVDLKNKMEYCLKNEDVIMDKSKNATKEILKYTWEQRVKNILHKINKK